MIAFLIAFGVRRGWLIRCALVLLFAGFLFHSLGIVVRGVLAGRWPIHNQFESFMAITWFAVVVGGVLMFARKQWLFGASASALGGGALLLANTVPIPSNHVGQVAGILATSRILYVHVNMVLFSYGLIALGFFVSLFYLVSYYLRGESTARFTTAAAGSGRVGAAAGSGLSGDAPAQSSLLNDLDHAQVVVLQLAFWVLGVGIMLGAYWADHAWGRWWGWDPKETWALLTWMIYLMVIHLRFTVRNRGLVTAWLSVLGFVTMLWTYWGVNLLLAGLHSYA
jgi:cytochrome c-type biogenesis protein CcsB